MKNRLLLAGIIMFTALASGFGGFIAGRRSARPVNFKGYLIIDHQTNPPTIYLEQLDESVLKETHPIILNVKHFIKSRK